MKLFHLLLWLCTAIIVATGAVAQTPEPEKEIDHYLCYTVTHKFSGPDVLLKDQFTDFQTGKLKVGQREYICNPVAKTLSSSDKPSEFVHGAIHLVCYDIPAEKFPHSYKISNQFTLDKDKQRVPVPFTVEESHMLCVPTGKELVVGKDQKQPKEPNPSPIDHYKCYVGKLNAPPGLILPTPKVILDDEFLKGLDPNKRTFQVSDARYLCNPVEKTVVKTGAGAQPPENGAKPAEGAAPKFINGDAHLVCYELKPRPLLNKAVLVANQFEPEPKEVRAIDLYMLCLPSTKAPLL